MVASNQSWQGEWVKGMSQVSSSQRWGPNADSCTCGVIPAVGCQIARQQGGASALLAVFVSGSTASSR